MKLTREEAIQKCRDMWNWIADETEKRGRVVFKSEYIEEFDLPEIEFHCFLCEYSWKKAEEEGVSPCHFCPLDFGFDADYACENPETPYKKWRYGAGSYYDSSLEEISEYARQIANLPEREV